MYNCRNCGLDFTVCSTCWECENCERLEAELRDAQQEAASIRASLGGKLGTLSEDLYQAKEDIAYLEKLVGDFSEDVKRIRINTLKEVVDILRESSSDESWLDATYVIKRLEKIIANEEAR